MSWLRRNWLAIAGPACGVGAGVVGWLVSPEAGLGMAGACTAVFGVAASKWYGVVKQLTTSELREVAARAAIDKARSKAPK